MLFGFGGFGWVVISYEWFVDFCFVAVKGVVCCYFTSVHYMF